MQADEQSNRPRIGVTLGDVNGIGPEVAVRAALDERVRSVCEPIILADGTVVSETLRALDIDAAVAVVSEDRTQEPDGITVAPSGQPSPKIEPGTVSASAGQFAYDTLLRAIRMAKEGQIDAICTGPLNKAALAAADIPFPGHTEILAHECGVDDFAMMLHLSAAALSEVRTCLGQRQQDHSTAGIAIAHVTLHTSVQSVPGLLTADRILEKTRLVHDFLQRLGIQRPHVGVCALNPHAGEGGLFGGEESRIIKPAVTAATGEGMHVTGPLPADTIIRRAVLGEFQGVVAMYHDQGHIPVKLIGFDSAINVTLGIPLVRTSPTHGTAFDIAWQGKADPNGMIEAMLLAAKLCRPANKLADPQSQTY